MITITVAAKELLKSQYYLNDEDIELLANQDLVPGKDFHICLHLNGAANVYKSESGKHYWIGHTLGSGNVGTVQHVILLDGDAQKPTDCEYVIKSINKNCVWPLVTGFRKTTFLLEKAAIASLFPGKYESFENSTTYYIISPFSPGISLRELHQGPLDFIHSIQKITKAFIELHMIHHLSHGDLKAEHIIINPYTEQARLIDFGHTGAPNTNGPVLNLGVVHIKPLPIHYMRIPGRLLNSALAGSTATTADDIYVLGYLLQEKINSSTALLKNKFLKNISLAMMNPDENSRITIEQIHEKITEYLTSVEQAITTALSTLGNKIINEDTLLEQVVALVDNTQASLTHSNLTQWPHKIQKPVKYTQASPTGSMKQSPPSLK